MTTTDILEITENRTPYTDIAEVESEFYKLGKKKYRKGFYRMEKVLGYEFFEVKKPITVTQLYYRNNPKNKWHSLMVDDPLHWLGMEDLANKCKGKVLVGGLGMGLVLHHLVNNRLVDEIEVIEIDPQLVEFIKPYLPEAKKRFNILAADYFHYILRTNSRYDSAIIDLWVLGDDSTKSDREHVARSMGVSRALTLNISDKVWVWGVRGE